MKIGFTELIVILVVALIVLGPDKLPYYMKKLGAALREFRKYSSELTADLKETVIDPLDEAQRPLREAMEPLTELDKSLKADLQEVKNSVNNIGKPKPADQKSKESDQTVPVTEIPVNESGTAEPSKEEEK